MQRSPSPHSASPVQLAASFDGVPPAVAEDDTTTMLELDELCGEELAVDELALAPPLPLGPLSLEQPPNATGVDAAAISRKITFRGPIRILRAYLLWAARATAATIAAKKVSLKESVQPCLLHSTDASRAAMREDTKPLKRTARPKIPAAKQIAELQLLPRQSQRN